MARTVEDLAISFDAMQGFDKGDRACVNNTFLPTTETLNQGIEDLVIKRAGGYFALDAFPEAKTAVDKICDSLSVTDEVELKGALEGRSAAYLITNIESSRLHLPRLKLQPENFDKDTRDRFIAGAMLPASWYTRALQVRQWYYENAIKLFETTDILIAAATPCVAPLIGEKKIVINGEEQPLRPNLGYFSQPISAIGLPSCVVPTIDKASGKPIGVQIIAAPWKEDLCLRVAKFLQDQGFIALPAPFKNGEA